MVGLTRQPGRVREQPLDGDGRRALPALLDGVPRQVLLDRVGHPVPSPSMREAAISRFCSSQCGSAASSRVSQASKKRMSSAAFRRSDAAVPRLEHPCRFAQHDVIEEDQNVTLDRFGDQALDERGLGGSSLTR
jgi:hypothetical protein